MGYNGAMELTIVVVAILFFGVIALVSHYYSRNAKIMRALDEASRRWGPARPRPEEDEQIITLHFSPAAAPYVLARPWHPRAECEPWEDGGLRMAIRLSGQTVMFESWVRSWGPEVQVLRPRDMAERIATSLEQAARGHREGPERWRREVED